MTLFIAPRVMTHLQTQFRTEYLQRETLGGMDAQSIARETEAEISFRLNMAHLDPSTLTPELLGNPLGQDFKFMQLLEAGDTVMVDSLQTQQWHVESVFDHIGVQHSIDLRGMPDRVTLNAGNPVSNGEILTQGVTNLSAVIGADTDIISLAPQQTVTAYRRGEHLSETLINPTDSLYVVIDTKESYLRVIGASYSPKAAMAVAIWGRLLATPAQLQQGMLFEQKVPALIWSKTVCQTPFESSYLVYGVLGDTSMPNMPPKAKIERVRGSRRIIDI